MQKPLKQFEKIFLIDHALSFRYPDLRKALTENQKLITRLLYMLKFWNVKKPLVIEQPKSNKHPLAVEYDFMDIEDPMKYEIIADCITLSFYGNNIKDINQIIALCETHHNIKAFWLNDNPVSNYNDNELCEIINKKYKNIEMFNSKFTQNAGIWALSYLINNSDLNKCDEKMDFSKVKSINLSDRNIFGLENYDIFKIFAKLKKIELLGHELNSLETTNKFFNFLEKFPKLKELVVEDSVADIIWTLYDQSKLGEISKTLHKINGFELKYGRPE